MYMEVGKVGNMGRICIHMIFNLLIESTVIRFDQTTVARCELRLQSIKTRIAEHVTRNILKFLNNYLMICCNIEIC